MSPSGALRALHHANRKRGRGDLVGDERDNMRFLCAQMLCGRVGAVAEQRHHLENAFTRLRTHIRMRIQDPRDRAHPDPGAPSDILDGRFLGHELLLLESFPNQLLNYGELQIQVFLTFSSYQT